MLIHAAESAVKQHFAYPPAKSGDGDAAAALVLSTLSVARYLALEALVAGRRPILVSAHALEREGVNAIPEVFADELGGYWLGRWTEASSRSMWFRTRVQTDFGGWLGKPNSKGRLSRDVSTYW